MKTLTPSVWGMVAQVQDILRTTDFNDDPFVIEEIVGAIGTHLGWSPEERAMVTAIVFGGATEENWRTHHVPF